MTFAHVEGNKKLAASILGISRRALYNKLQKHRLA
jgi:DNA-binding protein Fis